MIRISDSPWRAVRADRLVWDADACAHLHRRAGFGANWDVISRDLQDGFEATLGRLLAGEDRGPDGRTVEEFEAVADALAQSVVQRNSVAALERLWLYRMIHTPHPLSERMTLMWHGHYAISQRKVQDPVWMLRYYEALREHWNGQVSTLHLAILRDPAMLRWLDGLDRGKEEPNENLAREFFELFALGEGAYTEFDVRQTARALTGWQTANDSLERTVRFDSRKHDDGEKLILGQRGRWGTGDVVRLACSQEQAAIHIASRLFREFVSDSPTPDIRLLRPLADAMRVDGDVDVGVGTETILRSELFHSPSQRGRRIKAPVELIVGAVRACDAYRPAPQLDRLSSHARRMGQRLFHAPSVAGWPVGMSWLKGPWVVARANFAADFPQSVPGLTLSTNDAPHTRRERAAKLLWGDASNVASLQQRIPSKTMTDPDLVSWLLTQPEAHVA